MISTVVNVNLVLVPRRFRFILGQLLFLSSSVSSLSRPLFFARLKHIAFDFDNSLCFLVCRLDFFDY